jgi:hypothetical protein
MLASVQAAEAAEDQRMLGESIVMAPFYKGWDEGVYDLHKLSKARRARWVAKALENAVSGIRSGSGIQRLSRKQTLKVRKALREKVDRHDLKCSPATPEFSVVGFETRWTYLFVWSVGDHGMPCGMSGYAPTVRLSIWSKSRNEFVFDSSEGPTQGCGDSANPWHMLRVTRSGKTLLMANTRFQCQEGAEYREGYVDLNAALRKPKSYESSPGPYLFGDSSMNVVKGGHFNMPTAFMRPLISYWPLNGEYVPYERKWWNDEGELVWSRILVVRLNGLEYQCKNAQDYPGKRPHKADARFRKRDCPTVRQTCRYDSAKNAISCEYEQRSTTVIKRKNLIDGGINADGEDPGYIAFKILKDRKVIQRMGYTFSRGAIKYLKEMAWDPFNERNPFNDQ